MLSKVFQFIEKIIFNPPELCTDCQAALAIYDARNLRKIKSGFNKNHCHKTLFDSIPTKAEKLEWDRMYNEEAERIKQEMVAKAATTTPTGKAGDWYWHVHHGVLVEQLTGPLDARIADIKASKNAKETRLHFMRPVQNPPANAFGDPEEVKRAQVVYNAVKAAYNNGDVTKSVLDRASARIDAAKSKVSAPTKAQWEALHKKECFHYCPWDGNTLLPVIKQGIL